MFQGDCFTPGKRSCLGSNPSEKYRNNRARVCRKGRTFLHLMMSKVMLDFVDGTRDKWKRELKQADSMCERESSDRENKAVNERNSYFRILSWLCS